MTELIQGRQLQTIQGKIQTHKAKTGKVALLSPLLKPKLIVLLVGGTQDGEPALLLVKPRH